jgi:hypothetical protein
VNKWLQGNSGYTSGNDLIESATPPIDPSHIGWGTFAMHTSNDVSLPAIQALLLAHQPVIANVMQGAHFVLVTGWNDTFPDALAVNDPGFNTLFYSYSQDVVGWRFWNMTDASW